LADDPIRTAADAISGEVAGAMGIKEPKAPPPDDGQALEIPSYVDAHLLTDTFEPSEEHLAKLRGIVADFRLRGVLKPDAANGVSVDAIVGSITDAARQLRQLRSVLGPRGAETRAVARDQLSELSDGFKRVSDDLLDLIGKVGGVSATGRRFLSYAYEQAGGTEPEDEATRIDPLGWQACEITERAMTLVRYFEARCMLIDVAKSAASVSGREKGSPDFIFAEAIFRTWLDMRGAGADPGPRKHLVEWLELCYEAAGEVPAISTTVSAKRLIGDWRSAQAERVPRFAVGNKVPAAVGV
jgi:hypothetical protein